MKTLSISILSILFGASAFAADFPASVPVEIGISVTDCLTAPQPCQLSTPAYSPQSVAVAHLDVGTPQARYDGDKAVLQRQADGKEAYAVLSVAKADQGAVGWFTLNAGLRGVAGESSTVLCSATASREFVDPLDPGMTIDLVVQCPIPGTSTQVYVSVRTPSAP